jgi:hypothetical protein
MRCGKGVKTAQFLPILAAPVPSGILNGFFRENPVAKSNTFIANVDIRPADQLVHLVLALPAETASNHPLRTVPCLLLEE